MDNEYDIELEKLKKEYMIESEIVLQKMEKQYNEMVKKVGHKKFFSQSINKPIMECNKKYQIKLQELRKKYCK